MSTDVLVRLVALSDFLDLFTDHVVQSELEGRPVSVEIIREVRELMCRARHDLGHGWLEAAADALGRAALVVYTSNPFIAAFVDTQEFCADCVSTLLASATHPFPPQET